MIFRKILCVYWLAVITACSNIQFKEPQPTNGIVLTKIPEHLNGKYVLQSNLGFFKARKREKKNRNLLFDTLIIESDIIRIVGQDHLNVKIEEDNYRSILKQYCDTCYSLSIQGFQGVQGDSSLWEVMSLHFSQNSLDIYQNIVPTSSQYRSSEKFRNICKYDSFRVEKSTYYTLHPTPEQFEQLINQDVYTLVKYKKVP